MWGRFGFDYGGGGGSSLDYVISQNIDYVICERPHMYRDLVERQAEHRPIMFCSAMH